MISFCHMAFIKRGAVRKSFSLQAWWRAYREMREILHFSVKAGIYLSLLKSWRESLPYIHRALELQLQHQILNLERKLPDNLIRLLKFLSTSRDWMSFCSLFLFIFPVYINERKKDISCLDTYTRMHTARRSEGSFSWDIYPQEGA